MTSYYGLTGFRHDCLQVITAIDGGHQ